jgi:hAT family C-terminal dimerisation region
MTSESTFNTSGRTLNPVKRSLSDESIEALICGQNWLRSSVIGIIFSIIATYIFGISLWYPFINLLLSIVVLFVAENDGDFGDTLWPTDEAAPTDGVCDSET